MTDRIIVGPACLDEGAAWLSQIEPRFAAILPVVSPLPLRLKPDGFGPLLHIITWATGECGLGKRALVQAAGGGHDDAKGNPIGDAG